MSMFNPRKGDTVDGEVQPLTATGDLRDAILYDFDIDDDTLKSNHTKYLDDAVQFLSDQLAARAAAGGTDWTVSIDGFASKTGESQHNEYLSKMREAAVEAYLKEAFAHNRALETRVKLDSRYHGFRDSPSTGEDPKYRCVRVAVHRPGFPPPPIVPTGGSTDWKIRVYTVAGGAFVVVAGEVLTFQIRDVAKNACGVYYYLGGGISIPVPFVPAPGSIAGAGPFKDFKTTKGVSLAAFEGEASFYQNPGLTLRGFSVGGTVYLSPTSRHLIALPGTRKTVVDPPLIPMSTGSGFSIGLGSASSGKLSKPVILKPCCGAPGGLCTLMK
jgi:hypothetical protein